MSDRDTITLPREVAEEALGALQYMKHCVDNEIPESAITALRTALAAEQPKHPGYVIGSHWLETAYSRICAGEAEADVLRDIGLVRITDGMVETADIHAIVDRQEALRRDAERYRWLREVLNRFEYSSDGHIKRYPEEEVIAALRREPGDG